MPVSFVPKSSLNTTQQREQEEFALTKKMKKILDFYLIVSLCLSCRTTLRRNRLVQIPICVFAELAAISAAVHIAIRGQNDSFPDIAEIIT